MYAPIVLFVYNRADHVKKTLEALANNILAKESELYIFSDGSKSTKDKSTVEAVREVIHDEMWITSFNKVNLIESQENNGLAKSIINGVDMIIKKYKKIIVIEDDCVSSKDFLLYMNNCLGFYENDNKIWSIGGYSVNLNIPEEYPWDVYLMGRTCSYAWATWIDRWTKVDWNVSRYNKFKYNPIKRREFNEYGMDRSKMLDEQQLGIKNSWAIRFCYAMFENKMFTIYPCKSKIKNIGYDIGTHVTKPNVKNIFAVELTDTEEGLKLSHELSVELSIKKQFTKYFKRNRAKLFIAYICNVLLKIRR